MATTELTSQQIADLVGTRHATIGFEYPANGLQPYYEWLVRSLHLLAEGSSGALRVERDDTSPTTVNVAAGRVTLDGTALAFAGETQDLAAFNNDTAYVWLANSGGNAVVNVATDAAGWPATTHLKLAEVTLSAGTITNILDRRFETVLFAGLAGDLIAALTTYSPAITTQGSTASASTVTIQLNDFRGNAVTTVEFLRVRICDNNSYGNASNASIAAGTNTTVVETITAGKDLVLQSHTDGSFNIDVTDATAETVTLRIGPAPLMSRRGDYTVTQNITHA